MIASNFRQVRWWIPALVAIMAMLVGCGSGAQTSQINNGPSPTVNNTAAIAVNAGPAANDINVPLVTVTVCVPGTTTCQAIPNVILDTGSTGLRLLGSQLSPQVNLPQVTDSNKNGINNCIQFGGFDYMWGQVALADVQIAGEKASSVPVQVVPAPTANFPTVPSDCLGNASMATPDNTVTALGANGLLGIGIFRQDCGQNCAPPNSGSQLQPVYYTCPASGCTRTAVVLTSQLQNPVSMFPQDNSGFLISLPAIPSTGSPSVNGSLIFGIGTQSNNQRGNTQVYPVDSQGYFKTLFNGTAHKSFLDAGSNAFYFLDANTSGMPVCSGNADFYCPTNPPVPFTVTVTGTNGTPTSQVSFTIVNANNLSVNNFAFNNLGGTSIGPDPSTGITFWDWGLPFFFGRNVFIGIEGPNGNDPTPSWGF